MKEGKESGLINYTEMYCMCTFLPFGKCRSQYKDEILMRTR